MFKHISSVFRFIIAVFFVAASMSTQASAQSRMSTLMQTKPDYQLGAGDSIRVQVFQNPDLTVETRVSESGSISYPLTGELEVGGLSLSAAERKIADALKRGGFVQNPQVTITLTLIRGNQVAVLGQVNRPGRFPLETANTRLSDMLANAGGATSTGDDVAIVVGKRNGRPFRQQIDIPSIFLEEKLQDDIVLQGGDSIYVHRAPVFYIYGETQRPGAYRVERGMTIMQALATGGGPTTRGSESRLRLHRKSTNGGVVQSTPQLTDSVRPNDVIFVNESIF
ncbi:MAG: polysaccharide export protein EpsE [Rhodoferax sp.]|jgi:polysaccharide export outer membrane protein|uniref:polysaccharide export protein EpsE n=1 Tax=Rhodoferax sp. TaxID=50421 RepID=UPI001B5BE643|nr:polysaccharide export protein EpsE [Rhodoferax sp.]MBP9735507.1 polysaccharide export protein EpsE [Rhodoferax sp.]